MASLDAAPGAQAPRWRDWTCHCAGKEWLVTGEENESLEESDEQSRFRLGEMNEEYKGLTGSEGQGDARAEDGEGGETGQRETWGVKLATCGEAEREDTPSTAVARKTAATRRSKSIEVTEWEADFFAGEL